MAGIAALLASVAFFAHSPMWGVHPTASLQILRTPHVQILIVPLSRTGTKRTSCKADSSQASGFERKLLPVACEQPPRTKVNLNAATGGASWFFGGR